MQTFLELASDPQILVQVWMLALMAGYLLGSRPTKDEGY